MLILNFSHPLTSEQQLQIEAFVTTNIDDIRTIPVQINQDEPLDQQIIAIVNAVGLSPEEWQTRMLLINPPGYAPAAFALLRGTPWSDWSFSHPHPPQAKKGHSHNIRSSRTPQSTGHP